MPELPPNPINGLQPGDVINFADLTELVAFEDIIVAAIKPDYDLSLWKSRQHLRNYVIPKKVGKYSFNGTLANISLTVMENPYQSLLSTSERGFKGTVGNGYRLTEENEAEYAHRYRGFEFLADAQSTGRGTIAQVQTEMYYYPLTDSSQLRKAGTQFEGAYTRKKTGEIVPYTTIQQKDSVFTSSRSRRMSAAIGRIIATPKTPTENFVELSKNSRRIGFALLQNALNHPIYDPFGGQSK